MTKGGSELEACTLPSRIENKRIDDAILMTKGGSELEAYKLPSRIENRE
jgi:hypothetical protein